MNEKYEKELIELKKKFGKIITLTVPLDEDDSNKVAIIFVKKPGRETRSMVSKLVQTDTYRAIEAFLKNVYVGGDDLKIVLENDDAIASCEASIVELLTVQQAVLKKN